MAIPKFPLDGAVELRKKLNTLLPGDGVEIGPLSQGQRLFLDGMLRMYSAFCPAVMQTRDGNHSVIVTRLS